MKVVFLLAAMATCVVAMPNVANFEITEETLASILKTKEDLIDFMTEKHVPAKRKLRVRSFSYTDCGGPNAMMAINSVDISPDPLSFPGPLNVGASINIKSNIDTPLTGNVTVFKKVLGKYVKLPCIDNFGSCVYDGLCELMEQIDCPSALVNIGLDCRCPLKAKSYTLPKTEFDVDASLFPSGDYRFIGNATMNGNVAACLDLVLTVN